MITKQDLLDAREQMQEDLMCLLGDESDSVCNACQIIVDRMKPLIEAMEEDETKTI
jgi:hypothetical protein